MFDTHKVTDRGFEEIAKFKQTIANAIRATDELIPEGREKAIFITKMEEAIFFATKAIASKALNHKEVTSF